MSDDGLTDDAYAGFAERYDAPTATDAHRARTEFLTRLFQAHDVARVLDCACGSGDDVLALSKAGFEVVGSDTSDAMLAVARRKVAAAGADIPLRRADYRQLPEVYGAEAFDAIVCMETSIAHMPDDEQAQAALRSMRGAIRPGGMLILDQGTTDRQWAEQPRFFLISDSPQLTRLYAVDYAGQRTDFNVLDVIRDETGRAHLETWRTELHILLRDDQERLIRDAGFAEVRFYGGYAMEPYDRGEASRLIAVAVAPH